jgi:hypothetical protein
MFNFKKREYKYKYGDKVKAIVIYGDDFRDRQVENLTILESLPNNNGLQYYAHRENENQVVVILECNVLELLEMADRESNIGIPNIPVKIPMPKCNPPIPPSTRLIKEGD